MGSSSMASQSQPTWHEGHARKAKKDMGMNQEHSPEEVVAETEHHHYHGGGRGELVAVARRMRGSRRRGLPARGARGHDQNSSRPQEREQPGTATGPSMRECNVHVR